MSLSEGGEEAWTLDRIDRSLGKAEQHWNEATAALKVHDHARAHEYYESTLLRDIRDAAARYPETPLSNGQTLKAWHGGNNQRYREAANDELEWVMEQLKTGSLSVEATRRFIDRHPGYPELWNAFYARKDEIAAARAEAAGQWVRLVVRPHTKHERFTAMVEEKFRSRWPGENEWMLIFGTALGAAEKKATRKTITADVNVQYAGFAVNRDTLVTDEEWLPPELSHFVTVHFKVEPGSDLATTWDQLEPVQVWFKPPEVISRRMADDFIEKYQATLLRDLALELDKIPLFEIHSGS